MPRINVYKRKWQRRRTSLENSKTRKGIRRSVLNVDQDSIFWETVPPTKAPSASNVELTTTVINNAQRHSML